MYSNNVIFISLKLINCVTLHKEAPPIGMYELATVCTDIEI